MTPSPLPPNRRVSLLRRLPAAMLSGLLLFLAAPGEHAFPLLAWVGLVPLLLALAGTPPRQAAGLGLACGLAFYLPLIHWIVIVLATYGQVALPLALAALLFLACYMAGYTTLFALLCRLLTQRFPLVLVAPALWVALDWVRGWLFTGFPWLDLGYTQYTTPTLLQAADLAGHHGLTFLIVLANALLASLITAPRRGRISCPPPACWLAALLLVLAFLYGSQRQETIAGQLTGQPQLQTAIVQGNIPQDQKWLPAFQQETVATYLRLSSQAMTASPPGLVVWPETAMPFYPYEHPLFLRIGTELTRPYQTFLLAGAPHRAPREDSLEPVYSNSAFLVSPDGVVTGRYDKQHLVPFGEYVPLRAILSFASPVVQTMGDFSSGQPSPPLACQNGRIGVLICYEAIFPELARQHAENGANLLVNITNDAWFGRSGAPWQHLAMSVLRAVETRKSLVRAANTGISCFVDPLGRITAPSGLFSEYARAEAVVLLEETSWHVRLGHRFPVACLGLAAALLLAAATNKRRHPLQ
ncbi:MAG: apolipoprotein N-acyltransferase [Thermodesulfobacteriota bacterium]